MKKWKNVAFLTAGLLLLALTSGIERGMYAVGQPEILFAGWMTEVTWLWMVVQLAFAAAVVGLVWLAFEWRPARWTGAVIGTVGLLILLYMPLWMSGLIGWVPVIRKATAWLYATILAGGLQSYTPVGAAVSTVLGGWIVFKSQSVTSNIDDHDSVSSDQSKS